MTFRDVLVFADGRPQSERALRVGAELARRSGGRLEILQVGRAQTGLSGRDPLLGEALDALQIEQLDKLRALAAELGVEASGEVRTGDAFVEIIRKARRGRFDLVVKAARGRERGGWPLFGSTAQHLVRKCPVPVWLVGEGAEPAPRRVLALLGGGSTDEARAALDRRVLEVACDLAALSGADVHAAAAWDAPGASLLAGRVPAAEIDAWVEDCRREAEESLGRALAGFADRINPARVDLVRGAAERELVDLARSADLVVIGTSPLAAGEAFLIREEAEDVINRLDGSVVAVKPEGFVSPVSD
jgi:nucleotide-binding universal stress UspA family protein